MKAIVVRQPWAWLIISGYKDIENRSWTTRHRGPLLIQASATLRRSELELAEKVFGRKIDESKLQLGGIIGMVDLYDITDRKTSKWFFGPYGWKLRSARRLPFRPHKGRLGLFCVA
jgi:hypothetical protein